MTTDEDLRYDISDRIAEISLAGPSVNALSIALLEQVIAALRRAAADENVRAVGVANPISTDNRASAHRTLLSGHLIF